MADEVTFDLQLVNPVLQRQARQRVNGVWENLDLPVAEQVELLRAQVESIQGELRSAVSVIRLLSAELPNVGAAQAQDLAFTRIDATNEAIAAEAQRVTSLETAVESLADSTALDAVSARVAQNAQGINAEAQRITALQSVVDDKAAASALETLETRVDVLERVVEYDAIATTRGGVDAAGEYAFLTQADLASASTTRTDAGIRAARGLLLFERDRADEDLSTFLDAVEVGDNIRYDYSTAIWYEFEVTAAVVTEGDRRLLPLKFLRGQNADATTLATADMTVRFTFNRVAEALAQWTVKTEVGDLVGGVGLLNDGGQVTFAIVADRLLMLPTAGSLADKVSPFTVSGGQVYIRSAVIEDATIASAKLGNAILDNLVARHGTLAQARITRGNIFNLAIGDQIVSDDYRAGVSGYRLHRGGVEFAAGVLGDLRSTNFDATVARASRQGWRLQANGVAEFDAASIRGQLQAGQIAVGNLRIAGNQITSVLDAVNIPDLDAAKIVSGQIDADRLNIGGIRFAAGQIDEGTFDSARIPDLDAGKITTGVLEAARISGDVRNFETLFEGPQGGINTSPTTINFNQDISTFQVILIEISYTIVGVPRLGTVTESALFIPNTTLQSSSVGDIFDTAGATRIGTTQHILFRMASGGRSCQLSFIDADGSNSGSVSLRRISGIRVPGVGSGTVTSDDFVYIRGTSVPLTPGGGTSSENHVPAGGWSRANPGTTATEGVYRSRRTRTFTNNVFVSATAWGAPELFQAAGTASFTVSVMLSQAGTWEVTGAGAYIFYSQPTTPIPYSSGVGIFNDERISMGGTFGPNNMSCNWASATDLGTFESLRNLQWLNIVPNIIGNDGSIFTDNFLQNGTVRLEVGGNSYLWEMEDNNEDVSAFPNAFLQPLDNDYRAFITAAAAARTPITLTLSV